MKKKKKKCLRIQKQIFFRKDPYNENKSYYQQMEEGLKYLELINLNLNEKNCNDIFCFLLKLEGVVSSIESSRRESLISFDYKKDQMKKDEIDLFVARNLTLREELKKVRALMNNISLNSENVKIK